MQSIDKPYFILITGPNGAGKTTFHDKILQQNPFFASALFANSDIEFKNIVSIPTNAQKLESIRYEINTTHEEIRKKLLAKFNNIIVNVGGDVQERITKKNDANKDYWTEQYSLFIHIPENQEYIIDSISSYQDLMYLVGGGDIHQRINAKAEKNNWYKQYKRLVNTIEVQSAIHLKPIILKYNLTEQAFQREAGTKTLEKIHKAFETKQNLMFETTGAGNTGKRLVKQAKKAGYNVYSFHPYVLRPELSIARVQHRVENGGHDVPEDVIRSRYASGFANLPEILSYVDIGIVMDNSGKKPYMPVFAVADKHITDFTQCPEYLSEVRNKMAEKYPAKSVKELLHTPQEIDIKSMTEEQRENFGQIVISSLLGQIR